MTDDTTTIDRPTPQDYAPAEGWDDDSGCGKCPHCGVIYSANGGYFEEVYGQQGTEYESIYAVAPGEGPWFCRDCWPELDANRRRGENHTLDAFEGGDA